MRYLLIRYINRTLYIDYIDCLLIAYIVSIAVHCPSALPSIVVGIAVYSWLGCSVRGQERGEERTRMAPEWFHT